jgi:hypothetical protein
MRRQINTMTPEEVEEGGKLEDNWMQPVRMKLYRAAARHYIVHIQPQGFQPKTYIEKMSTS